MSFRPGEMADVEATFARSLIKSGVAAATDEAIGGAMPERPPYCRFCGYENTQRDGGTHAWKCRRCGRRWA